MNAWQDDAREFGRFVRQGGWRLGLLVARNCGDGVGKVPIAQFAIEARIGTSTVSLYLRAWELAAEANLVPHAAQLTRDSEPTLDTTALPHWQNFYRSERQLTGRSGSLELHPDPGVMQRRMEQRPDAPKIASAVVGALAPADRVQLADELSRQVETEHVIPPAVERERPVYITVNSVQRVLDALALVESEAERLPPVMTMHSKTLLSQAAMRTEPTIKWLISLVDRQEARA